MNRSRLKGNDGEESALTSLAVLFEVLLTMTMIMSPFTPFFAEYLYQRLRSRLPTFVSSSVPSDLIGKADSIRAGTRMDAAESHQLMIGSSGIGSALGNSTCVPQALPDGSYAK